MGNWQLGKDVHKEVTKQREEGFGLRNATEKELGDTLKEELTDCRQLVC